MEQVITRLSAEWQDYYEGHRDFSKDPTGDFLELDYMFTELERVLWIDLQEVRWPGQKDISIIT